MHLKPPSPDLEGATEIVTSDPRESIIAATVIIKIGTYVEAKNIILSDIYWKEDVWDKEQLYLK
ncbi:hypothetical protein Clacol_009885 [Clathrus columnatus]|uniref:Uncharacterized protein n=1 Tax=Clathrus columnatus TaxID=1419009 RepID=A0AAV5AP83_9AGAM|nr:hypothetical protein Clacol_009885 [Clathrus columnatus]